MFSILKKTYIFLLSTSLLLPMTVFAETNSGSLSVSASVSASCSISNGSLDFGAYVPSSASPKDADTGSSITVTCTNSTPWRVYSTTTSGNRFLESVGTGAGTLNYNLYTSSARNSELGSSSSGNTIAGTGTGSAQSVVIYGRLPINQLSAEPDSYQGTANLTIEY